MYLKHILYLALFSSIWISPQEAKSSFHKSIKENFTKSKRLTKNAGIKNKKQRSLQPRNKSISFRDKLFIGIVVAAVCSMFYATVCPDLFDFRPRNDKGLIINKYNYKRTKNRQELELHKLNKQAGENLPEILECLFNEKFELDEQLDRNIIPIITGYLPGSDKYIGRKIKAIVNVPTSLLPSQGLPSIRVQDPITGEEIPLITEPTDQRNAFKVTSQDPIYFPATFQFFVEKNASYYEIDYLYDHFLHLLPSHYNQINNNVIELIAKSDHFTRRAGIKYFIACYSLEGDDATSSRSFSYTINPRDLLANDILYLIGKDIFKEHQKNHFQKDLCHCYKANLQETFCETGAFSYQDISISAHLYSFWLRENVYNEEGYYITNRPLTI